MWRGGTPSARRGGGGASAARVAAGPRTDGRGLRAGLAATALLAVTVLLPAAAAPTAGAAERVVVLGAGFGHGVGLSQYGARGMAARGVPVRRILSHYYRGTSLGSIGARQVRVALQTGRRETTVSGAVSIGGITTKTTKSYRLIRKPSGIEIRQLGVKKRIGRATSGIEVKPGASTLLRVAGRAADGVQDGSFRGTLDVLPDGGNLLVVNALDIEDYLRGVVTEESPSSWPTAALRAQAIVARTYAITNAVGGRPFDQWPDTRSQVYTGVSGETGPGDAAIAATRGQVVTLGGRPVITYFFSTSGGRTEDSSKVFGGAERSWLQSVRDPDEAGAGSPLYRWTRTFSTRAADARTSRFGVGGLRRIEILERGDSPRVVRARIVGSTGSTEVDGGQLQRAFALPDRWATFANVSMSRCLAAGPSPAELRERRARRAAAALRREQRRRAQDPNVADAGVGVGVFVTFTVGGGTSTIPAGAPTPAGGTTTVAVPAAGPGGPADAAIAAAGRGARELGALLGDEEAAAPAVRVGAAERTPRCRLVGGVRPAPEGAAGRLQRRQGGAWRTVRRVALEDGRFETVVPKAGTWRVKVGRFATPVADL